jgi:hypothetical protein
MKQYIKKIIPEFYLDYRHKKRVDALTLASYKSWREEKLAQWIKDGKPLPPPHAVKQRVIAEYQSKYGVNTLVETGTFHGEMIEAQKRTFKTLYSIELDDTLYSAAVKRFKYDRNIHLLLGDSGEKITDVISVLENRAIFWLDGHYSGTYTALGDLECPILKELDGIFSGTFTNHILLIDDARCFVGANSYPTPEELLERVKQYNPNYLLSIDSDIIRLEVK